LDYTNNTMGVRPAKRYLKESIEADLVEKMVFVSGPRQVGKGPPQNNLNNFDR